MKIANPEQTRKIMQVVGKDNGEYFSSSDRKDFFRSAFFGLDFGKLVEGERRPLPK